MWRITETHSDFHLWFSDGKPVDSIRGGNLASSRLVIDKNGFLDLTEITLPDMRLLNANDSIIVVKTDQDSPPTGNNTPLWFELSLRIDGDGGFELSIVKSPTVESNERASGKLKPLPEVFEEDVNYINKMIERNYVPYQNIPDAPGKTEEEIKALGKRLFPFSPFSFQLAMCIYDWTTASFTRMVFMKIFEYTGIPPTPFPIDDTSVAEQIWDSNWPPYDPQNPDFMNSFMMNPAQSLEEVKAQLDKVGTELHKFSDVQNRLLSAATQALPRASILLKPQLFSGQVDICQLGLDRFGIEFLECPLNKGPVSERLIYAFADAMASYISTGNTITTKMVWSFTDSIEDAMHYSNGILLVANPPGESWVWESAAYVTDLSDDPKKIEYVFAPGTQFEVQSVDQAIAEDKHVVVITLEPKITQQQITTSHKLTNEVRKGLASPLKASEAIQLVQSCGTDNTRLPHTKDRFGGRRCACCRRV
ncbi:uncharacterized protein F4817DRAFT_212704 [Daldinia loculata]|uniref:uncharacterized protein n=1 Tax=Daldinia loculata TaxID=103429 RepID=UPI0020C34D78|nr:uncharacterized protein F4817DRAFT_212704 [Daldinia loculata]KAI1650894.1 hypothetical protein F4817DRAFT_212704 [Daldinia loculata]